MPLQPDNPLFIAGIVATIGVLLVILWLITIVLRLLFPRREEFPAWQPAYRVNPALHPDSLAARRQLWQQQAPSDALPIPCERGAFAAHKVLAGMDGAKLGGWQITGLRVSQYDMYGRVSRTTAVAPKRTANRLNQAIRQNRKWTDARLEKAARKSAGRIADMAFDRSKRTPTLPLSVDVRFRGLRGDVRVIFELLQCSGSDWTLVDQWEPEMIIPGDSLIENYTYALAGQRSGESRRQFKARLNHELTAVFAAMIRVPPVKPVVQPPPPPEQPPFAVPAPLQTEDLAPQETVAGPVIPPPQLVADDTARMMAITPPETMPVTDDLPGAVTETAPPESSPDEAPAELDETVVPAPPEPPDLPPA